MEKRIGIIGIVIEDPQRTEQVNNILHQFAELFMGRMGIPCKERGIGVITLIADGTTDQLSALTGALGRIDGVSVKSMLSKQIY